MVRTSILAALVVCLAGSVSLADVQLNISSGFNTDNWCGVKELQQVIIYAENNGTDPDLDLNQVQPGGFTVGGGQGSFDSNNYNLIGAIDEATAAAIGGAMSTVDTPPIQLGYCGQTSWYRPAFKSGTQATALDGVLTSAIDGTVYHIASHAGNATLSGDWLEVANPSFVAAAGVVTTPMERKMNAMTAATGHSNAAKITATATLPLAQQGKYPEINFVLGAWDWADGARNAQIVAIYSDASEDILYSFSTDNVIVGPSVDDSVVDNYTADFTAVAQFSQGYNVAAGATGGVSDKAGSLFEFITPLTVDVTKVLVGVRLEDSNPALNWNARGLSIYAATAIPEPASLALLAMGGVAFVIRRRRR